MKILFVLEYYYPHIGGVEKLFKLLAEELVRRGKIVNVLTNRYNKSLPKKEVINGVRIRRLSMYNRFFFTFLSIPFAIYYAGKCDIIHTTSFNAALPAYIAARFRRKKVFITFHEAWGKLWFKLPFISAVKKIFFYYYEKIILNLSFSKFIAVSDSTMRALINLGIKPKRIIRIYNGIDYDELKRFPHTEPEEFTFTYCGRLGPSKGMDILMPASKEFLMKNKAKLKLIIPKERNKILKYVIKYIKSNSLDEKVDVLHELKKKQLFNEIANSSCIVVPSYCEGFCFVAAESAGIGTPIISSNEGALKEVVSRKYIQMESLGVDSLTKALIKGQNKEWNIKPVKKFEYKGFLDEYCSLYI